MRRKNPLYHTINAGQNNSSRKPTKHEKYVGADFPKNTCYNQFMTPINQMTKYWATSNLETADWQKNVYYLQIFATTIDNWNAEILYPISKYPEQLRSSLTLDSKMLKNLLQLDNDLITNCRNQIFYKSSTQKTFEEFVSVLKNAMFDICKAIMTPYANLQSIHNDSSAVERELSKKLHLIKEPLLILINYLIDCTKVQNNNEIEKYFQHTLLGCYCQLTDYKQINKRLKQEKETLRNKIYEVYSCTTNKIIAQQSKERKSCNNCNNCKQRKKILDALNNNQILLNNLLCFITNLKEIVDIEDKIFQNYIKYLKDKICQIYIENLKKLSKSEDLINDVKAQFTIINDKLSDYLANFSNYFKKLFLNNSLIVHNISYSNLRFYIDTARNLPNLWYKIEGNTKPINNIPSSLYEFINQNKEDLNNIQWLKLNYKLSDNTTKEIAIIEDDNFINKKDTETINSVFYDLLFNPIYDRIEKSKREIGKELYNNIYWFLQYANCVASISDITKENCITSKLNDTEIALDSNLKCLINYKTCNTINAYIKLNGSKDITFAQYCCLLDNKILSILANFIIKLNEIFDYYEQTKTEIDDIGKNIIIQMMKDDCKVINNIVIDFKDTLKRKLLSDKDTKQAFLELYAKRKQLKKTCLEETQIGQLKKGLLGKDDIEKLAIGLSGTAIEFKFKKNKKVELDAETLNLKRKEEIKNKSKIVPKATENEELWKAIETQYDDAIGKDVDSSLQFVFWAYNSFLETYEDIKKYKIQSN